jgi:two-component system chemotaxis sensor kinase CheA
VFISIHDDGAGIDPTRIKERLAARELLTPAEIDDMSDEQTLEYIWHPGFSTAQEISDISGRGVGMDAVRTRITELSGTIDVDSVPGQGTAFTIRLPLTLAIIGSLLARVRNVIFSMPIEDVREIVNVPSAEVVTVRNRQTIDVRGEFIPLIDITDVFDWHQILDASAAPPATQSRATSAAIDAVILRAGERAMALRVDELLGSQDIVIKSLSQNFVQIKGLSGASILGDGTVSLMLDVHTVMNLALNPKEKVPELDPTG